MQFKLAVSWLSLVAIAIVGTATAQVIPQSCADGQAAVNPFPIFTEEPTFVQSVPNAKLYIAGNGTDAFYVLHVWGSGYEKGYAQGQIMKEQLTYISSIIIPYLESQILSFFPNLSPAVADLIAEYGVYPMLLLTYEWTEPYMKQEFIDEMEGLAAGSGVSINDIRAYNMFPELTKAACTIVGANGPSTPNKFLNQLRALDIGPDIPIKDAAQVTVYHSSDSSSTSFMTVGWSGMIGALTGFSASGIGIGEKVWTNPDAAVDESVSGEPWMFVLRNVLQYTSEMRAALESIHDANRTCSLHIGVGSASENTFNGLEISAKTYKVFNTSQMIWPGHPYLPGVFYWDYWPQPSTDSCLGDLLHQSYGNITAEILALQIAPLSETGEFHCVTFDYENKLAFIANSRKTNVTEGSDYAYMRQFTRVDMGKLFAEQSP